MYNKMIAYSKLSQGGLKSLELLIKHIEKENVDAEQYLLMRMKQSDINVVYSKCNSFINDDGVDYIIKNNGYIYIIQLKFNLKKVLNRKEIKRIYGDMILSRPVFEINSNKDIIKYLILSPFINNFNKDDKKIFRENKLYLINSDEFIGFFNNPKYYLENCI